MRRTVIEATRLGPKCWRLRLDCGHEAPVIVGHVPAIGSWFTCTYCAALSSGVTQEKP